MAVINLQHNHTGVQAWETKYGLDVCAGRGAMTKHADGYLYTIFARNYVGQVAERRLYLARTLDQGVSWSEPIEITAGAWDDDPAVIPLDETDPNSALAVTFTRSGVIFRTTVNKETGATSAIDSIDITTICNDALYTNLVRTLDGGYAVFALFNRSGYYPQVRCWRNVNAFTMNSWTRQEHTVFPANQQPFSLSVKRMLNGDLMMTSSMRTAFNGSALSGLQNLPKGILQTNVAVAFSSNDGISWSSVQQVTNYAGNTTFNMNSFDSVVSSDCVQLSDGRVVVAYEEHKAPMYITDTDTTGGPTLPFVGIISSMKYHAEKNMLFFSGDNITLGGVFVLDLNISANPSRIMTTSAPAYLWTNDCNSVDISPDGTLLVVGSLTGGVTLIDIEDPDPANWRTVYCMHYLADPGDQPTPKTSSMFKTMFANDNTVVFSYHLFTDYTIGGGIWKYTLDDDRNVITTGTNKHTITNMKTTGLSGVKDVDFVIHGGRIVAVSLNKIQAIRLSDGLVDYSNNLGIDATKIFHCPRTGRFIAICSGVTIYVNDNGSEFSVAKSINVPLSSEKRNGYINGYGLFEIIDGNLSWTSNANMSYHGKRSVYYYLHLGENLIGRSFSFCGEVIPGWLVLSYNSSILFVNLKKTGRLRYGFFEYDSTNKRLITDGVDFWDVCNALKMGDADTNRVHLAAIMRDQENRLYLYCTRYDVYHDSDEFGVLIGTVEPDVKRLYAKARIRNSYSGILRGKTRIQNISAPTFGSRMRVSFAQCIKSKARIVPRVAEAFTSRATIKGSKSYAVPFSFDVLAVNRQARCTLQFTTRTGYTRGTELSAKAYIAKVMQTHVTGHFLVAMTPTGPLKPSWGATVQGTPILQIRVRIQK